jgi:plastocyanin
MATPKPTPQPSPTTKPSPAPPPGPTHALEMTTGYRFSPSNLTIGVGDAVRAHNGDTMSHTFTGSTWDSGDVAPGAYAQTIRFNKAGTFRFICTPHQDLGMTGTLTVR